MNAIDERMRSEDQLQNMLSSFVYKGEDTDVERRTCIEPIMIEGNEYSLFINQFWTSRQRQGNSLHEISYRACFKPQLPEFFIDRLTGRGDTVYDPFGGRGTTPIEAGLHGRKVIVNDINPLSTLLTKPRLNPPTLKEIGDRLSTMRMDMDLMKEPDLSMFYHPDTEREIRSLRKYLLTRERSDEEDHVDSWIRMVATNRLTGHSSGFFSVYTLPPNQATSSARQIMINQKRDQVPQYRDVKKLILKKSKILLRDIGKVEREILASIKNEAIMLSKDATETSEIRGGSIELTVTSPPFLNVVNYSLDNWLRCWFNGLDAKEIQKKMTLPSSLEEWERAMGKVFIELHRIMKNDGWVAFEVGEVRNGNIRLEESVIPLGIKAGFKCAGVLINSHDFTKTSNIWGISNNARGTNTNRVVLFRK